jgi:hypothetical protein
MKLDQFSPNIWLIFIETHVNLNPPEQCWLADDYASSVSGHQLYEAIIAWPRPAVVSQIQEAISSTNFSIPDAQTL